MNEYGLLTHSFNVGIAVKYGVNDAIVLSNIFFWVSKNADHAAHYHDVRYWTYNSVKAFAALFPYLTNKQIRGALDRLIRNGLIVKGNYNRNGMDQTAWYAVTDKGYELYGQVTPHSPSRANGIAPKGKSNCPVGQMQLPPRANAFAPEGRPIPDINTDEKQSDVNAHGNPDGGDGGEAAGSRSVPVKKGAPTLDEVRDFVRRKGLRVDADRFFEVNTVRGWVTKDGVPIDDWQRYILTWERYETAAPTAARPDGTTAESAGTDAGRAPTIEEVMEHCLCDRATAEELIREHLV